MAVDNNSVQVSVLGLGEMGRALADALVKAGHGTTVWNRTPGRAGDLVAQGARAADTAGEAVRAGDLVIACLLDHASVHEVLDPLAGELAGRTLINLTTTSPAQARESAEWAARAGIAYLDGGIMATPEMIGGPGSSILYSGSGEVFDAYKELLDLWGTSTYFGEDAGLACLYDLALLSGMYVMFAGFLHGVAMVTPAGVTASEFAALAAPFMTAMTSGFEGFAAVVDGGDYTVEGQQSLSFSQLGDLVDASADQGVGTEVIAMVQALIQRQIDAGHGEEGFARIIESIRQPG
ncbi:NAD(P)-dependent oxidoreductase [Streptomyces sp. NPDC059452]|uniref:NAD(P)-dependent oxidoreductase n=1 Tax=Streptomyces sp. NPDC059452 TaxID=3346835 RepID=UPI0036AAFDBB